MRIARILTRLNLGGPARQVLASDPELLARGHEVRIFTGRPEAGEGDLFEVFRARGLDVVRVPGLVRRVGLRDLWAVGALRRALAAYAPELLHTHASKAGALGRRAAQGLGARTVHTFHGHVLEGYYPTRVSRWLVAQERRLAARTDRIVAVSHATADDLVRLGVVEEGRLVVIPPGIDLAPLLHVAGRSNHLRRLVGADEPDVLVGVVGRLAAVKRPLLAVDVFEVLAERYPHLHVVFVGDGDQRRALERRVLGSSEAVRARVHLVGAQPNMLAVLGDLDVVLSTSRSEGMPVALIEAAAAGLPVVATPVGGVPELVAHERTGFLGDSVDELAYGLAQLLDDQDLRRGCGHRGRLRVESRHSAPALADRLESLYRTVLEEAACALLMVSGDRQVAVGERGPFHAMQREFSRYFERIDVICPKPPGEVTVRTIHDNVHFHPATVTRRGMVRYIVEQGGALLREHGHRLIVSHDYGWFYNGLGSAALSREHRVPYLSELHHVPGVPVAANLRERVDKWIARAYVRWARGRAIAFRVVNETEMPGLLARWGVPARKVLVLPSLYIDQDVFCPAPAPAVAQAQDQDVLFVGRMVGNKGVARILRALAILKDEGLPLRGLFVGKGPLLEPLSARAQELGVDARFLEWVDRPEDLAEIYRRSRVCVCASTCEGGPRFTVEAMACGTPVVSTAVGVMPDLVGDGRAGGLSSFDDHGLAAALRRVLENEELRRAMGAHAVEVARPFEYAHAIAVYANGLRRLAGEAELELGRAEAE